MTGIVGRPILTAAATRALEHLAPTSPETDYYRDYFTARAYAQSGDPARASAITDRMASQPHPGPQDRWSAVGGDLYTTALALLSW